MSQKPLDQIEYQIEKIKAELQKITVVRPGSLTRQYRDRKTKAGLYYQLSYTHHMKSRTEYVRAAALAEVRQQIKDYKRLKKLLEKWIALGIRYSQLSMKMKVKR